MSKKLAAKEYFKKAIELKPDMVEAYEPLVRLLAEQKQYEKALSWNKRGIAKNGELPPLILNEANIYSLKGELVKSKKLREKYQNLKNQIID